MFVLRNIGIEYMAHFPIYNDVNLEEKKRLGKKMASFIWRYLIIEDVKLLRFAFEDNEGVEMFEVRRVKEE